MKENSNISEKDIQKEIEDASVEVLENLENNLREHETKDFLDETISKLENQEKEDENFDALMASLNKLLNALDDNKKIKTLDDTPYITCELISSVETLTNKEKNTYSWSKLSDTILVPRVGEKSKFATYKKIYLFSTKNNMLGKPFDDKPVIVVGKRAKESSGVTVFNYPWVICNSYDDAMSCNKDMEIMGIFDIMDDEYERTVSLIDSVKEKMRAQRDRHLMIKGDVIITDPCYIIKERDSSNAPKWDDFHPYKNMREYPDYDKETDSSKLFKENSRKLDEAYREWEKEHPDDRDNWSNYDLSHFGIYSFIARDTIIGDWSCETINSDTREKIGEFCADGGEVGVYLLDEVLRYNPDFNYHIERPWTTTLIKDFDGEIWFEEVDDSYVKVIGKGNINFETRMKGFDEDDWEDDDYEGE